MKKELKDKSWILIVAVIVGILILNKLNTPKTQVVPGESPSWLVEYQATLPPDYQQYLQETTFYDYSNPQIQAAVEKIRSESKSAKDAATKTLDFVYQNVGYSFDESDSVCFSQTASSILKSRTGQCDTQSRVNIAILRGIGIAARPEGGCLSFTASCFQSFAAFGQRKPQTKEIVEIDGQASRAGGLHEWLEIYLPEEGGWVDGEATAGQIITAKSCTKLIHEMYPVNTYQECVSVNQTFIQFCRKV